MGVDITNFAHPGDSMLETMGLQKSQRLESILPGADILSFSGGRSAKCLGNDLI